jgi:CheY-like chemotaxis protein
MKLMIVDDHAATRGLIREAIGSAACAILECANGREAVQQCDEFRPDVITMDLQMGPVNGLEATRRILARHPGTHIIVVTQSSFSVLRGAAFESGARHFVTKDDLSELRRIVSNMATP